MRRSAVIFVSNAGITVLGEVMNMGFSYEYYFSALYRSSGFLLQMISVSEKISEREEYDGLL